MFTLHMGTWRRYTIKKADEKENKNPLQRYVGGPHVQTEYIFCFEWTNSYWVPDCDEYGKDRMADGYIHHTFPLLMYL